MFSSRKKNNSPATNATKVDSLIGQNTELHGDVVFSGGFHVDGKIHGNIRSDDSASLLTVSDHGMVEGEVHVPNIILNGTIKGDVYASERVELAANARVLGNVYYHLIEMAAGSEVNGNLVRQAEPEKSPAGQKKDKSSPAPKINSTATAGSKP
ncbi:MAG TPA: polymer-forming cytoskeletal protein [Candidatus Tenderia sp.]|nr:polymer-forming cytoskeletal protein [Candidatus Tenderia sp.]